MASIGLGRVGFVLRDEWLATEAYNPLDVVSYNGESYAARVASKGITPSHNTNAWQALTDAASAASSAVNAVAVRYDAAQSLTEAQKETARGNIGAPSSASLNSVANRVGVLESDLRTKITVSGTTLVIA